MGNKEEPTDEFDLSELIRKLRRDTGVTQAQLAKAIGVAPTSIYRYEAGSSKPDLDIIKKLQQYAADRKSQTAQLLIEVLLSDIDLRPARMSEPAFDSSSGQSLNPLSAIAVDGRLLTPREQLAVIAFVLMMRNNTNEVTENILRVLMQPWMAQAKEEYDAGQKVDSPSKADD